MSLIFNDFLIQLFQLVYNPITFWGHSLKDFLWAAMAIDNDDDEDEDEDDDDLSEGFEIIDEDKSDDLDIDENLDEEDIDDEDDLDEDRELDVEEERFFEEDHLEDDDDDEDDEEREDDDLRENLQNLVDSDSVDSDDDYYYGEYDE